MFDGLSEGRVMLSAPSGTGSRETPEPLGSRAFERIAAMLRMSGMTARDENSDRWGLVAEGAVFGDDFIFAERRELPALFGYDFFVKAGIAYQMMNFTRNNMFCGSCGGGMRDHDAERARECPSCGNLVYPTMSPAIIVAVTKDDMLLMGHGAKFPAGRYSVLAGFVEPGETFEEAVHREICEEAGIEVENVRYFGSQPWPFPNSMMIAFKADWKSGEPRADEDELTDVKWFSRGGLPDMPHSVSISRRLIDDWFYSK